MQWRALAVSLIVGCSVHAVIIDQIAVVVGNSIVKDSDISRDLRVTEFLNAQRMDLSEKSRKAATNRLIDQIFIRQEIRLGDYPVATPSQADAELERLEKQRFKSAAAMEAALRNYGLGMQDLRSHFLWQLTVLRFIDARFKPAVLVTDTEVEHYYHDHASAFRREHPGKSSLDDVSGEISDILSAERINKLFFSWLDEQRKDTKIKYLEESLQ